MTLEALRESELQFRELIEFAVDGILIVSKDKIITGANSYMNMLTGRPAGSLIGISINDLFGPDQLKVVPLRYDLVEDGEMVVSHRDILRPDGTWVPVEMHTKMMPNGSYQSIYHDISNRKQAEQKLRESQEKYKLITDKMADVVWLMDLNGKSTLVSPSIEQFTGFTVDEYMKQSFDDRFTPESAAFGKALLGREITRLKSQPDKLQGFSHTQQMEYACKNGSTKWGELLMTPYFGKNNVWLGIHGVTRDITERKKLEEALRASEAKFVKAFQNSPDPFVITQLSDGKYIDINESYLRLSGYTRDDMIGKTFKDVNIWANLDDRLRYISQLMQDGRISNFETNYKTKSGEIRCCTASAELIEINAEQCIVAIIHDITDRKLMEESLKDKALELERFNSLMIGRELKMIELKREINALLVEANKLEKYIIHE